MEVQVNYLAVFLAAASSMMLSAIWYSQGVFGKKWARLANVKMDNKSNSGHMAWLLGSMFIASLITAFILAHVSYLSAQFSDKDLMASALSTAIFLWLGFSAARMYIHDSFEGRRKKLTGLNVLHELSTFIVMAVVIGVVGL